MCEARAGGDGADVRDCESAPGFGHLAWAEGAGGAPAERGEVREVGGEGVCAESVGAREGWGV